MRIDNTDRFWVVTDASPVSELGDVLFETTIEGLERQFKGGLSSDHNVTLFTDHKEAEAEAKKRLAVAKVVKALKIMVPTPAIENAATVEFKSKSGVTIFKANLK
jgi:hypothetical protein